MVADMGFCRIPVGVGLNLYMVCTCRGVLSFGGQNGTIQSAVEGVVFRQCVEWR
jgi:hypothetical protein